MTTPSFHGVDGRLCQLTLYFPIYYLFFSCSVLLFRVTIFSRFPFSLTLTSLHSIRHLHITNIIWITYRWFRWDGSTSLLHFSSHATWRRLALAFCLAGFFSGIWWGSWKNMRVNVNSPISVTPKTFLLRGYNLPSIEEYIKYFNWILF